MLLYSCLQMVFASKDRKSGRPLVKADKTEIW